MNNNQIVEKAWAIFLEQGRESAIEYMVEHHFLVDKAAKIIDELIDKAYSVAIGSL
jgi:hypothetical protein